MASFLAIDADAGGLFVAAGAVKNGTATVERVAHLADTPPLSEATAAELGARLRELLHQAGIRPAPVLLALGRDRVILKEVRHPPAPPAEEPAIVRFQAVKDLADSPDDVVMDYAPLPPVTTGERQASVAFVSKELIAVARVLCEAAGLRLAGLTPRPFVAGDLLRASGLFGSADAAHGLLILWPTGGEFTVVRGRDVLFTRPIPPTAAATERGLVAELRRNLAVYDAQRPNDPLMAIAVAEPDNAREGWADRLGDVFPLPFHKLDPLAGTADDALPDSLRARFAGPVAVLQAKSNPAGLPINFMTPRQPRPQASPHRARSLVAVLLGVLVVGSGVAFGYIELAKASSRYATAKADRDDLDARLQALELEAKRLAAADEFANREVVWLDELYDLADRIPDVAQVRLTEIDGSALAPAARAPTRPTPAGSAQAATAAQQIPKAPAKPTPVAQMRVVLTTENPAAVQGLADSFSRDRFYTGTVRVANGPVSSGARGQQYTVTTQILHRTPAEFTRVLPVSAPPRPGDAGGFDGFGGFGGGFGGFGGGFGFGGN